MVVELLYGSFADALQEAKRQADAERAQKAREEAAKNAADAEAAPS